jgi:hypothetical protein
MYLANQGGHKLEIYFLVKYLSGGWPVQRTTTVLLVVIFNILKNTWRENA